MNQSVNSTIPLNYNLGTAYSDGLYLLIANVSNCVLAQQFSQNTILNNEIKLLSNVDQVKLCGGGGRGKNCDMHTFK
jgi:hypothetical protein